MRWSRKGGVERGLTALFTELARVARFGFTAGELSRMKLNLQRGLERAVVEKDKSPSGPLADEFIRNFIQDEPIPGIVYEYGLNQRFLPEITLAEVNAVAKNWMPDRNRLVAISAPESDKAYAAERRQAGRRDQHDRRRAADGVRRHRRATSRCSPVSPPQEPWRTRRSTDALGITEWRLSNGVRVVLKPTTFKQDEILFRAVSPGGTSLASDEDFIPAETADAVIAQGGLGGFSRLDLEKVLAGTTASVRADIGRHRGRARRRRRAQGSRDDVPADLPHLHRAAGRSGRLPRADRAIEGDAGQSGRRSRTSCSTRRSTPR